MTDTQTYKKQFLKVDFIDPNVVDQALVDSLLPIAQHYKDQNDISCRYGFVTLGRKEMMSHAFDGTEIQHVMDIHALPKHATHKRVDFAVTGPHGHDILNEIAGQFEGRKVAFFSRHLQEGLCDHNAMEIAQKRSNTSVVVRGQKIKKSYKITHSEGIHARPSMELTKIANAFKDRADIVFTYDEGTANGLNIMDVILLGAKPGKDLIVEVTGKDRDAAMLCVHNYLTTGDSPYIEPEKKIDLYGRAELIDTPVAPQKAAPVISPKRQKKLDRQADKVTIGKLPGQKTPLSLPAAAKKEGQSIG